MRKCADPSLMLLGSITYVVRLSRDKVIECSTLEQARKAVRKKTGATIHIRDVSGGYVWMTQIYPEHKPPTFTKVVDND